MDGRIVGSDAQALQLEDGDQAMSVACAEVEDIDHPGNVLAILGGVASFPFWYGATYIVINETSSNGEESYDNGSGLAFGFAMMGTPGLAAMGVGLYIWLDSVLSATGCDAGATDSSVWVAPTVVPSEGGTPAGAGLSLSGRF